MRRRPKVRHMSEPAVLRRVTYFYPRADAGGVLHGEALAMPQGTQLVIIEQRGHRYLAMTERAHQKWWAWLEVDAFRTEFPNPISRPLGAALVFGAGVGAGVLLTMILNSATKAQAPSTAVTVRS
jgi:hypothetical protein